MFTLSKMKEIMTLIRCAVVGLTCFYYVMFLTYLVKNKSLQPSTKYIAAIKMHDLLVTPNISQFAKNKSMKVLLNNTRSVSFNMSHDTHLRDHNSSQEKYKSQNFESVNFPNMKGGMRKKYTNTNDISREEPLKERPPNPGKCKNNTTMVVIIHTSTYDIHMRNAIRKGWGSQTQVDCYTLQFYYLVGWRPSNATMNVLFTEMHTHKDIILGDFMDTYTNLSIKSTYMLKWIVHHCNTAKYMLKADDDTYVDLHNLITALDNQERVGNISGIYGYLFKQRKPKRDPANIYYVSRAAWQSEWWPSAVTGPAYVISIAIPKISIRASLDSTMDSRRRNVQVNSKHTQTVPERLYKIATNPNTPIGPMEDIIITGVVRERANVPIYDLRDMRHIQGRHCSHGPEISFHRVYVNEHSLHWKKQYPRCDRRIPSNMEATEAMRVFNNSTQLNGTMLKSKTVLKVN